MGEEKKIYLVWQPEKHMSRYVVGEFLKRQDSSYVFRYIHGKDLDDARDFGFSGYPGMPDFSKEYSKGVIDIFGRRIPERTSPAFKELLEYWAVDDPKIGDFELICISGAKTPVDLFEFIDPHTEPPPTRFLTEVAGVVYFIKEPGRYSIKEGEAVEFKIEHNNIRYPKAVQVFHKGIQIGYVKRVQSETIYDKLSKGSTVMAEIKNARMHTTPSVLLNIQIL